MRLARVTVAGFKSFADTTEFRFDAPVIGIVGPNGCGKSNVVDAIKWVLGERSAKSLRGDAMLDVIFAGSAARKPMGAAAVTLTFDNPVRGDHSGGPGGPAHGRLLDIDTEEVDVTRRLYRDGRSEYLINGQKCRLRDIRELFMDTGIGTHAYSIIEQGRVDAMLTANPLERRAIFEEAAGIARFRARKIESERKLERAEVNLVRVREQLASTERRLKAVRRQAERARRYRQFDARLRQLRIDVALDTYHDLRCQLEDLTRQVTALEAERRTLAARLVELEDAKQASDLERHERAGRLRDLEQQQMELAAARRHAQQRQDITERNLDQSSQQVDEDKSRADGLRTRVAELGSALSDKESEIAAVAERAADGERRVARLSEACGRLQEATLEAREAADRAREAAQRMEREHAQLSAQVQSLDGRAGELAEQSDRLLRRHEQLVAQAAQLAAATSSAEQQFEAARREVQGLERELEERDRSAATLGERQAALAEALTASRHQRAGLESRRHLLQEMHQAREGLGESVKTILDQPALFPGVRGLLADAIETDRDTAPLVEAALGRNLELLLVDSPNTVRELAEAIKGLHGGRVGFIAADWPPCPPCPPYFPGPSTSPSAAPVAQEILSRVQVAPHAEAAVQRLLGRTLIVEDLATALRLRQGELAECRFVTRGGDVIEPDGRLTSGPGLGAATPDGWLSRRMEMAELARAVAALDERLAAQSRGLHQLSADTAEAQQQRDAIEQALHQARHRSVEAQYRLQRLANDAQRVEREQAGVAGEHDELTGRSDGLRRERAELARNLETAGERVQTLAAAAAEAACQQEAAHARAEAAREELTAARVDLGQVSEKLEAVRRERRHVEAAREESARQHALCLEQLHRRLSQIEQYEAAIADAATEVARAAAEHDRLQALVATMQSEVAAAQLALAQAAAALESARADAADIDRRYHAAELSRREVEVKREALEERCIEELELELTQAYVPYRSRIEEESHAPLDRSAADGEIDTLREEIRRLGPVNLEAIDEEAELEEQNQDLVTQVADIDGACKQLTELMRDLDEKSLHRFKETFATIRENFAGDGGMFRRLFGGGSADMMLLPDEQGEVDWLGSGIEIRAKPPGKEPRVINQLSGGEKTMTAVALLMAIFKSKPSPFCVLDEVDAALDDANVDRFCHIVHQFLDGSHFIVITHNKRTMLACDRLYGVTMQERGVSKRVAVHIDHINEDGTIKKAALRRAEAAATEKDLEPPLIETKPRAVPAPMPAPAPTAASGI